MTYTELTTTPAKTIQPTISSHDDVIDSRDVIARIEELKALIDIAAEEGRGDLDLDDELEALKGLADEAEGSPDWEYGEALIRDSYFPEYAEELANDIGAINSEMSWPCNHIDWEAAGVELQQDYFTVDFDGAQYWLRA